MDISGSGILDRFNLLDDRYQELIIAWKLEVRKVDSLESIKLKGVALKITEDSVTFLIDDTVNHSVLRIDCCVLQSPTEVVVESVNVQFSEK